MKFLPTDFQNIKFIEIFRELFWWSSLAFFLIPLGFWLNPYAFDFFEGFRFDRLDQITILLTEELVWWFQLLFTFWALWVLWKKPHQYMKILTPLLAFIFAGISVEILKSFFAIPRPYEVLDLQPLVNPTNMSFPSGHTTLAFSVLIPFYRIYKPLGIFWFFLALIIALSRIYENVHYPSDIAAGIILGGSMGGLFSNPEFTQLLRASSNHFEFRRQTFHFLFGLSVVFLHWAGYLQLRWIALVLMVGLLISIISQFQVLPIISDFLATFDRKRDKKFPGRGAFYFLLGVFLTFSIFRNENLNIAYASILIMAVGDSLNHLFCSGIKRWKVWWNPRKNWLGVGIGIIAGIFASHFFVPWPHAILATTIAIIVETITFRIRGFYLDDNLIVPLLAGGILFVLKNYPCWFFTQEIYQYLS